MSMHEAAVLLGAVAAAGYVAAAGAQSRPAGETILVPQIDGPWWRVAGDPDLGELTARGQQPVDFGVWQAADGTWQLWSCIRRTRCGGKTRLFHRWEGKHLTDKDWTPCGIAMQADPKCGETPGGLQAPHVVRIEGTFHMFYGDWENICLATSTDGKAFTRRLGPDGASGMFTGGDNTRDPMVLKIADRFHCYYTTKRGAVECRTSKDLKTWSDAKTVSRGGSAGSNPYSAECPHVLHHESGYYYLFRTQRYGQNARTSVYRSRDPMDFGIDNDRCLVGTLPVAAPEIVLHQGQYYMASLLPSLKGIRIAKLTWAEDKKGEGSKASRPRGPSAPSAPAGAGRQTGPGNAPTAAGGETGAEDKARAAAERSDANPLSVMFDTDMDVDNDDLAAAAILHALADEGKVRILAMGVASRCPHTPGCLDAINTYYGRGDIPIGVYKGRELRAGSKFAKAVAERCPHKVPLADQVPPAVAVYRRALAGAPDAGVTMIAVGQMNNLVDLLDSPADELSDLSGLELVKRKVRELFVMAPYFNERNSYQRAYNFSTCPSAAAEFVAKWPTTVRFGEGNLGHRHFIGERLSETPADNPVRIGFEAYFDGTAKDRHCADPTTVLYAVLGTRYFDEVGPGLCDLRTADGFTRWRADRAGRHYYNKQKLPVAELERIMEDLLVKPPAARGADKAGQSQPPAGSADRPGPS